MSNETSSLDEKKSVSDQVILQEVNKNGEQVDEVHEADYSEEQYKKILKKIVTSIFTSLLSNYLNVNQGLVSLAFNVGSIWSSASG